MAQYTNTLSCQYFVQTQRSKGIKLNGSVHQQELFKQEKFNSESKLLRQGEEHYFLAENEFILPVVFDE